LSIDEFLDQYTPGELEKLERKDPLKKFSEKIAVQKTIVGKEMRESSPIRSPSRGGGSSPSKSPTRKIWSLNIQVAVDIWYAKHYYFFFIYLVFYLIFQTLKILKDLIMI